MVSTTLSIAIMVFGIIPIAIATRVKFPKMVCFLGGTLFGMGSVCLINSLSL